MPRISSSRSEASEVELDGLEHEFLRLQQEYRIMEGDRKAYSEESQYIIRKQKETIAALQAENDELMKDNRLAGSQQNQTQDSHNVDALNDLLKEEDQLKKDVERIKKQVAMLDQAIQHTEKKISQQRKSMGGVHMSQTKHVAIQKHIRVLENRLDQGNGKFNKGLAKNSKLRNEIDHLRTERIIFQGLYTKLEKRASENKEEISKVIEASTAAYIGRDDAQNKMIALKEKSDKELLQHNTELKELMRIIDHDQKLRDFMNVKYEDRAGMHGLSSNYRSKKDEGKEKIGEKEEAIQSYETAFKQIKETTGIDDLNQLVGKFIETEDKNFALFNYVNEVNNEIELMQEKIGDTLNDIKTFHQDGIDMDKQRKRIIDDLQGASEQAAIKATEYQANISTVDKLLTELKQGIESLFTKINCDAATIADILAGQSGISENNMMLYLGIIEQRTNELIQVQAFVSAKDSDSPERPSIGLLGKGPLPPPASIFVNPPGTGDEHDSDFSLPSDDENRPLTQDELRKRIMRGISKRENNKAERSKNNLPSLETTFDEKSSTKKLPKNRSTKDK